MRAALGVLLLALMGAAGPPRPLLFGQCPTADPYLDSLIQTLWDQRNTLAEADFKTKVREIRSYSNLALLKKVVKKGDPVTLCYDFPDAARTNVKYFRVRQGQTPAGAYVEKIKLTPDTTSYTFTPTVNSHLFISAVYSMPDPVTGQVTIIETPGSNHVQIVLEP